MPRPVRPGWASLTACVEGWQRPGLWTPPAPPPQNRPVPRLNFTPQLKRFLDVPEVQTQAITLRAALTEAFSGNPRLRAYVLDEQGHLRPNVVVFIDGRRCLDRVRLDDALQPDSQVYVMQALSGG